MKPILTAIGGSLLVSVFFHRRMGYGEGPAGSLVTIVASTIALLCFVAAFFLPKGRTRPRSPVGRIAVLLTMFAGFLGLLVIGALLTAWKNSSRVADVSSYLQQQPMVIPVPAASPPVPPPPYSPAPPPSYSPAPPPPPTTTAQGEFGAFDSMPPRPPAKPAYTPPANQPGEPTELIGGPEGWQFQVFDREQRQVVGFRHAMGSWGNQPAVAEFTPLFDRTAHAGGADLLLAREGYAVGSLEVVAEDLVNAVRVQFVRQRPDGTLDDTDAYFSDWIGDPAGKRSRVIGDGVTRVIGICGRHGAVKNALALILDKSPAQVASAPIPANSPISEGALFSVAKAPRERSGVPVYEPPPGQPGRHTELAGGPEGWQFQAVDQRRRVVIGFRFRMGSWGREPAVAQFDPLYQRDEWAGQDNVVIGRNGYVVGGLQVVAGDLVNAVRIIFVRQRTNGSLDKSDFYLSDWIGDPGDDKPQVLGDGQSRVIGICGRNGAVKNAIALVLDKP